MPSIQPVAASWLIDFVNEFSPRARVAAGEENTPYPDVWKTASAPPRPAASNRDLAIVADRLWQVFAGTDQKRASSLNALIKTTALSPRTDEEGELRWTTARRSGWERLLAACTATLLTTVTSIGWDRFGICAGDRCQDVYADLDGRGSRRYCSTTCLNRARVRAYRQRQTSRHR